jgi:hypothetical protein
VGLSCDKDWPESKLFEQLKKLTLLSREGKLDKYEREKERERERDRKRERRREKRYRYLYE